MTALAHTCHAIGCSIRVPPRMLMCARHWRMVPRKTQITVWNEYRPGQEMDKKPSLGYLAIQRMAVGEVAEKEGRHDEAQTCFRAAVRYVQLMKESGQDFRGSRSENGQLALELTASMAKGVRS
jgi:hypothetical protein